MVNHDLAEYHVPMKADALRLDVLFLPERDIQTNPIHAKGIGLVATCGAGAAIANAVFNTTSLRVRDMPIMIDTLIGSLPDDL